MPTTLKSRLPEIAAELPNMVDAAIEQGAEVVAEYARFRVPVEYGDLRDAIHVDRDSRSEYEVVAGDKEVFYGHMVEHGTSHSAPEPFLVPALEDAHDDIVHIVETALEGL
jgi:HK97 gp10 family phage protein